MPILSIKANPPSRYPNVPLIGTGLNWYIAQVKPRQEKSLAFDLMSMEIGYYLPLFKKSIRRPDTGKLRSSFMVMFPSYVPFECEHVPSSLIHSDRVCKILEVKSQDKFRQQLNMIYQAQNDRMGVSPVSQIEFMVGRSVRIIEGPCKGMIGRMVKMINDTFLVLELEGLGFAGIRVSVNSLETLNQSEAA
jgi:hypothetical protein